MVLVHKPQSDCTETPYPDSHDRICRHAMSAEFVFSVRNHSFPFVNLCGQS